MADQVKEAEGPSSPKELPVGARRQAKKRPRIRQHLRKREDLPRYLPYLKSLNNAPMTTVWLGDLLCKELTTDYN
ncbi:hypothetical protein Y1Q_0003878 [Alligator mississippiensis]|uniref:Uncharacterized protein n=1 Tax=Alligator mississippiensis TaxID=8496 RepID=A0A151MP07_ALLMI|nr:hypothetical protein Y1Q_0003878 [Alligator mississippiensis]